MCQTFVLAAERRKPNGASTAAASSRSVSVSTLMPPTMTDEVIGVAHQPHDRFPRTATLRTCP